MPATPGQEEIDEAGPGDLGALDHAVGIPDFRPDPFGQIPCGELEAPGECQRNTGREIPVLGQLGGADLYSAQPFQLGRVDLADHPLGRLPQQLLNVLAHLAPPDSRRGSERQSVSALSLPKRITTSPGRTMPSSRRATASIWKESERSPRTRRIS
jgi:hypothetical protein